ncbi:hypothetical protein [Halarcobacter bivalviorum]|uniref:SDH C-terminal domain-containing protein n=1 Tax=Halarcobacter bivalviorum TaxID=663364 RepID=A0AAX2ADV4_9BACT|nr:hypothetical protein [Halarcobacter bivalviorum]RXK11318.1 hypothetical protein CRV05_02820 [Halarcobacter bivalviorum]
MFLNVFICKIITKKSLFKSLFSRLLYLFVFLCRFNSIDDMLLYQGVLAFEYFTNSKADKKVIEAMRKGLKD